MVSGQDHDRLGPRGRGKRGERGASTTHRLPLDDRGRPAQAGRIIQQRGRQMQAEVKLTVAQMVAEHFGELYAEHAEWLDEQATKGYVMAVPYNGDERNYHLTIKGMQKLIEQERNK